MFPSFTKRSRKLERLDTGDYTDEEYKRWLVETRFINRWLGDSRALRLSLNSELADGPVSLLDVGAGSGELLKSAGSILNDRPSLLVGAEINSEAASTISRQTGYDLKAVRCDALELPFADGSFDFVVSSLFLHHLGDEEAIILIKEMKRVARRNFFIIDLHRHRAAYYLYRIFGPILLQPFTIEDGSLSILRSFRPDELERLGKSAGIDPDVKRRLLFRLVMSGRKAAGSS